MNMHNKIMIIVFLEKCDGEVFGVALVASILIEILKAHNFLIVNLF